jgi:hypothetical protein
MTNASSINATVLYYANQLPRDEKEKLISELSNFLNTVIEEALND